ncbi:MAG: ABC transporter permease [Clostridia bacterium]|nr:ABC transporter permease [Clostridia bacterium]
MVRFIDLIHSEMLKLWYSKITKIVLILVVVFQAFLTYTEIKQILEIGLDATPETNESLIEAIPPIEYLGFDSVIFGMLPMIVLGACYGGIEYKKHGMRTALLCCNNKKHVFLGKIITIAISSFLISFISVFITIVTSHITLGNRGLPLITFNKLLWKFIILATLSMSLITVLSFIIAFGTRSTIISLMFLIPQIYNIGNLLGEKFVIGKFLPIYLGNQLIATSEQVFTKHPLKNIALITLWIFFIGIISYFRFKKSDLGGKY